MSKRSSRRLAVVAGAALAVGSMAPALAARVDATGTADVDASAPATPSAGDLVPTGLITDVSDTAFGTVLATQGMVLTDVDNLLSDDALGIVDELLGGALSVDVDGNADAGLNVAGASVEANGVVDAATGLIGLEGSDDLVGDVLGIASPVVGTAVELSGTAIGLASTAPDLVLGTAIGVADTGLGLIDGLSASGEVNVLASLMGSF